MIKISKKRRALCLVTTILTAAGGMAGPARAQEGPPTDTSGQGVEDIIVTAQKRSENLQDVPVSITAVTSDTLSRLGVDGTVDLQTLVPGFQASQVNSASTPSIRGIGSTDPSGSNEGAVALYVDGVYYPSQSSGIFSFANIERIEVLKGPQGTLFGRNATGGLVNVITKTPSDELEGSFTLGYGKYDSVRLSGYLTGGIAPGLAADISVFHADQNDGWGSNIATGKDVYRSKETGIRTKLYATPGDATKITISADYVDQRSDIGLAFLPMPTAQRYTINTNLTPRGRIESYGASLRFEHDFDFAQLLTISGYRHVDASYDIDQDRGPLPIVNAFVEQTDRSFTQEIQLLSNESSKLKWILGGFFMHRKASQAPLIIEGLALAPVGFLSQSIFASQKTRSLSVFGQATYPVFENTNVTVGARYTSDRQIETGRAELTVNAPGNPVVAIPDPGPGRRTFSKLTYRFALDQKIGDTLLYASYDRGFKAGYFNLQGFPASSIKPEVLDSLQFGVKTDLFDRRLRVNAAAFLYDYSDIQIILVENGSARGVNAGKATVNGFELDLTAVPVDDLNLRAGVTWLPKARYKTFDPCPSVTVPGDTCNGSRMIRSAKWSVALGADYTFRTPIGDITPSASFNYSSEFPWVAQANLATAPAFSERPYGILNAQISWKSVSGNLNASIWAKNITDKDYGVYGTVDAFGPWGIPGAPFTWGATLGFSF